MKRKFWGVTLILTIAIILTFNQVHAAPSEIVIGATAPLTGPAAEAGIALRQGITMLVDEWNAKGGIQIKEAGKKIPVKVIIEDSQSKPEVGVSVGEKLITRDKVHFLMGDCFASSVTMAILEFLEGRLEQRCVCQYNLQYL
jgi:branched-chain amino acid transport system substrate-binding protein